MSGSQDSDEDRDADEGLEFGEGTRMRDSDEGTRMKDPG